MRPRSSWRGLVSGKRLETPSALLAPFEGNPMVISGFCSQSAYDAGQYEMDQN